MKIAVQATITRPIAKQNTTQSNLTTVGSNMLLNSYLKSSEEAGYFELSTLFKSPASSRMCWTISSTFRSLSLINQLIFRGQFANNFGRRSLMSEKESLKTCSFRNQKFRATIKTRGFLSYKGRQLPNHPIKIKQ